jgi:hypothetical protein
LAVPVEETEGLKDTSALAKGPVTTEPILVGTADVTMAEAITASATIPVAINATSFIEPNTTGESNFDLKEQIFGGK